MKSRRFPTHIVLAVLLFHFAAQTCAASELTVAAASDLIGAFREIGEIFEKKTAIKVTFIFGSSGMLSQQIAGGAPVDLFASASGEYIEKLGQRDLILRDTMHKFAKGRIVLLSDKEATIESFRDLTKPAIQRIAIANPSHAPYGRAAQEFLKNLDIWKHIKDKIVYGENVRQTLQYYETGNVDAAIVALSLVIKSEMEYKVISEEYHSSIEQTLAVIKGTSREGSARSFANFVSGEEGIQILEKYGFIVPYTLRKDTRKNEIR